MTSLSSVDHFLSHKHLALAGASRGGRKFGNTVLKVLTKKGYQISLLHPAAPEIDGLACYRDLTAMPPNIGGIILVVPPEQTEQLVRQAAAAGVKNVWMQQGSETPAAIEFCRQNGIDPIHGECILMFAQPTGFHRFHRWVRGVTGKLPR